MTRVAPDCIPEWKLGAYVDDGLEGAAVRHIETHLVSCEDCRRIVMSLREESGVLAAALHGDARSGSDAIALEAPARGVVTGLPVAIGAAIIVATGISLVFEARLPASIDWLHPARLLGVSDMFWNLVFLLRDDASGLLEFVVGVGALASVAALGTFVAGAVSKRLTGTAVLVAVVGSGLPVFGALEARAAIDLRNDEEVIHIRADEVVDGVLFASGRSVIVEGTVNGDAVLWAKHIDVSGVIEGNLVAGGDDVELTGTVRGSLIGGGDAFRLDGTVEGSAAIATGVFRMGSKGHVERDLTVGAGEVALGGDVARDANIGTRELQVTGRVGRDLTFGGERLVVTGEVTGDIAAHVMDAEQVDVDEARLGGGLVVHTEQAEEASRWARYRQGHFWIWRIVWLAGAFAVGMLLFWVTPGMFRIGVRTGGEFGLALGIGVVSLPLVVLTVALLGISIIGLPLAIILAVLYLAGTYLAFLVMSALIGRHITQPRAEGLREFGLSLIVGLSLVTVLVHLPFIGAPARLVLLTSGIGLLLLRARDAWRMREAPAA